GLGSSIGARGRDRQSALVSPLQRPSLLWVDTIHFARCRCGHFGVISGRLFSPLFSCRGAWLLPLCEIRGDLRCCFLRSDREYVGGAYAKTSAGGGGRFLDLPYAEKSQAVAAIDFCDYWQSCGTGTLAVPDHEDRAAANRALSATTKAFFPTVTISFPSCILSDGRRFGGTQL